MGGKKRQKGIPTAFQFLMGGLGYTSTPFCNENYKDSTKMKNINPVIYTSSI